MSEADLNSRPSAYRLNAVPPGPTGSQTPRHTTGRTFKGEVEGGGGGLGGVRRGGGVGAGGGVTSREQSSARLRIRTCCIVGPVMT